VTPVPAVTVVVAAREVVVVRLPGAVIAEGRVKVTVDPDPAVVTWLAVPTMLMFPSEGLRAPPLDAVIVVTPPVAPVPKAVQVEASPFAVCIHTVPAV
jgi:hypothetical protein